MSEHTITLRLETKDLADAVHEALRHEGLGTQVWEVERTYGLAGWLAERTIYGNRYQAEVWCNDDRWCVEIRWLTADGQRMSARRSPAALSLQSAIDMVLSDVDRCHGRT